MSIETDDMVIVKDSEEAPTDPTIEKMRLGGLSRQDFPLEEKEEESLQIPTIYVIKDAYDGENSREYFDTELDRALECKLDIIIIEPHLLAQETINWILMGNCLHSIAVYSGISAIAINATFHGKGSVIWISLTGFCVFCASLYTIGWKTDPCVKYQLQSMNHNKFELKTSSASRAIVLVRTDDTFRTLLHTSVAIAAIALAVFRFYAK